MLQVVELSPDSEAAFVVRDPRAHRRYRVLAVAYIAAHAPGHPCCLCGEPIDTQLSPMARQGPTIEHKVPVRVMQASGRPWAEIVAWACDTRLWGLAHRSCQNRQGAKAAGERRRPRPRRPSRW